MSNNTQPQTIRLTPEQASVDPVGARDNVLLSQIRQMQGVADPVGSPQPVPTPPPAQPPAPTVEAPAAPSNDPVYLEDDLDLGEVLGTPEPEAPAEPEKPATDFQMEAFEKAFQAKYGVELGEAISAVKEVQTFREQQVVRDQTNQIASTWGVSYEEAESRLNQVRERFSKYDPQKQAALSIDPMKGAQLIWNQLEKERNSRQAPGFDRTKAPYVPQQGVPSFTYTELAAMSPQEYEAKQEDIINAYRLGLVR